MLNKHIEPERVEMVMKMVNGEDVGSVSVGKELARNGLAQLNVMTEAG